jgi:CDP-glycerol glycerophosphotransferase (TagB/SpsB family)
VILLEIFIYFISFVFPKSKRVIVFGAWSGKSYSDNSRFLFEHFCEFEAEFYDCFFITKNKDVSSSLSYANNKRIIYAYSFKGLFYQLRANAFIYSSGYSDFVRCTITNRSVKINLWHGVPLKNVGYDDKIHQPQGLKYIFRDMRNAFLPFTSNICNYILSHNNEMSDIYRSAFRPKDGVIVSGLPRNDGLLSEVEDNNSLFLSGTQYIVYTPTFRDTGAGELFSFSELEFINDYCSNNNFKFLIKFHPSVKMGFDAFDEFEFIIDISNYNVDLYSCVLPNASILITDYSSIMFDFHLLKNSLILYAPDVDSYLSSCRGMYFDYTAICNDSYCISWLEVMGRISSNEFVQVKNDLPIWHQSGILGSFSSGLANKIKALI